MDKNKKNLKDASILVLVMAAWSLIRITVELIMKNGVQVDTIPEGATYEVALGVAIATVVLSYLLVLPQMFLGFKGLRMAKDPDESKGYILVAKILMVIAVISFLSTGAQAVNGKLTENIGTLLHSLAEAVVYFAFVAAASKVRPTFD